jgi:hypothetical protein
MAPPSSTWSSQSDVLPEHIVVHEPQLCGEARLVSHPACALLEQWMKPL